MLRSTTAMREIRQCSARERMRSSSSSRLESVRAASRVANSRAVASMSNPPSSAECVRTSSSADISATSAAKSICKAHSRALRREPIKYYQEQPQRRAGLFAALLKSFLVKIYQFHRRHGGFKTLVSQLHSRAIDCLIDRVSSDDTEYYRNSRCQSSMRNSVRDFTGNVIKMRRLSANDRAETNDCVKL